MKKIYKDRLLKLASFLENKVPKEHFDMASICDIVEVKNNNIISNPFKTPYTCKTTACAVGWCTAVFPELNLVLDLDDRDITHKNGRTWNSERFFGLFGEGDQWDYLFSAKYFRETPKQVAKRIREFVKSDGKVPEEFR